MSSADGTSLYRIGEAADLVGVQRHVLRYWETEFDVAPKRSATGHRMYTSHDVAAFLRIRQLLHDEGFTIAGARKALSQPTEGTSNIDESRVRDALKRLATLRSSLEEARQAYEAAGVASARKNR